MQFTQDNLWIERTVFQLRVRLNNCASHSRYFSDELDAQIFYKISKQMFTKENTYGII